MSGSQYDAPNQEVVRPDGSPPWEEGEGGSEQPASRFEQQEQEQEQAEPAGAGADLEAMTKDELLAYAQRLGVSPANASMTKDELKAGIEAQGG